jgi:hypothetical protein
VAELEARIEARLAELRRRAADASLPDADRAAAARALDEYEREVRAQMGRARDGAGDKDGGAHGGH